VTVYGAFEAVSRMRNSWFHCSSYRHFDILLFLFVFHGEALMLIANKPTALTS
jgi:hypothetical protein